MFLSYEVILAMIALVFYFGRCSKASPVERIIQTEKVVFKEKIVEVVKQTVVKECTANCISKMAQELYSASETGNDFVDCSDMDEQKAILEACQSRMNACMELAIKAHHAIQAPTV